MRKILDKSKHRKEFIAVRMTKKMFDEVDFFADKCNISKAEVCRQCVAKILRIQDGLSVVDNVKLNKKCKNQNVN